MSMSDIQSEIDATIRSALRSLNMHHTNPEFFEGMSTEFARNVQRQAALAALETGAGRLARLQRRLNFRLPIHRTEAGYPYCSTCDGGGCPDCTDLA